MRIGNLIENQENCLFTRGGKHVLEPNLVKRLNLDDHALVWRVPRNQAPEIRGIRNRKLCAVWKPIGRLPSGPGAH
jgi:hypothetical protein